jgi:hypothetical protein
VRTDKAKAREIRAGTWEAGRPPNHLRQGQAVDGKRVVQHVEATPQNNSERTMNVKITSDGTQRGTRVTREDGVEVSDSLVGVSFKHEAGKLPIVTMSMFPPFDTGLVGSGEFSILHPHTGKPKVLKTIVFADGERLEFPGEAEA